MQMIVRRSRASGSEAETACPFCRTPVVRTTIHRIEGAAAQKEAARRLIDQVRKAGTGPCPWCATTLAAEQLLAALRRVAPSGPWDELEAGLGRAAPRPARAFGRVACPSCKTSVAAWNAVGVWRGVDGSPPKVGFLPDAAARCPDCGHALDPAEVRAALVESLQRGFSLPLESDSRKFDRLERELYTPSERMTSSGLKPDS